MTSRKARKSFGNLSGTADDIFGDLDNENAQEYRAKEVIQAVLSCHAKKSAAKDAEIKKLLTKDDMAKTEKLFEKVLGVQLDKTGDRLFLSTIEPRQVKDYPRDLKEEAKQGLLVVVLAFIYVSKNPMVTSDRIRESALWEFLALVGIDQDKEHPIFGHPSKLIAPSMTAEFVAHGWISFEKVRTDRDNEDIIYELGPRALGTVDPMVLLETFCTMIGDDPRKWNEHYAKARKERAMQKDSRDELKQKIEEKRARKLRRS